MTSSRRYSIGWILGLLLGLFLLGNLDVQVISPILPFLTADFSISTFLAGFSVTIYSISGAAFALVVGPLSDRYGRILFLRLAAICLSLAAILAYSAQHFGIYLLARAFAGFAGGTFTACIIAQIADLFPYSRRGKAMGLVGAVYSLAAVIGVPAGAAIATQIGWRPLYLGLAIAALVIMLLMRSLPRRLVLGLDGSSRPRPTPAADGWRAAVRSQLRDYAGFWTERQTRAGLLLALTIASTSTSLMTFLGAWLHNGFSLDSTTFALVFLAAGVSTVIGSLLGGFISDWLGKQRLVVLSSLLIAAVMLTTYWVRTPAAVFAFCIAGGMVIALRQGPYEALITELVATHERGAYIAMRSTTAKLSIAITAALSGFLFDWSGYVAVTAFAGACSLWAACLVHFSIRPVLQSMQDENVSTGKVPVESRI